jgi:Bacterial PH domain
MYDSPETIIRPELDASERLLWCGQPRGGIRLRRQDAMMIPFSIMWGGFAIFFECAAIAQCRNTNSTGAFMVLWGIPFVLVGVYFMFGRFIADARGRARTYYGLTNERIIILSGVFSRHTKTLPLRNLSDLSLTERADGSGNITFGSFQYPFGDAYRGWPGFSRYGPPTFEMIENVRQVYDLIRNAQKE